MRVGIVAITFLCTLVAQVVAPKVGRYNAATCTSSGLTIFPPDGKEFSIALPITPRYVTFGASGESLYASGFKRLDEKTFTTTQAIFRIELNPVRVTTLPGSDAFYLSGRFAVSRREDMILFGGVRTDVQSKTCGVYELDMANGKLLPILESADCRAGSPWHVLDLAPNEAEALISSGRQVSLLDLGSSKITPLGRSVWRASYSPDGKWIAALELGGPKIPSKTTLIDRNALSLRRDLGGLNDDEVVWSPDSRLLLHADYRPACSSQNPIALETLDVETGKRSVLKNSVCKAGASRDLGWVSAKVGK